jgi:hypothetical protein
MGSLIHRLLDLNGAPLKLKEPSSQEKKSNHGAEVWAERPGIKLFFEQSTWQIGTIAKYNLLTLQFGNVDWQIGKVNLAK